jgi:hypothetical protein
MRPYDSALEHLDDVAGWVAQVFDRAQAAEGERRELDAALAERVLRIEARLEASRAAGRRLPWDRLRGALGLTPSEQSALLTLSAIELVPGLRARMRAWAGDAARGWPDVALLAELVYVTPVGRAQMLDELSADGALRRLRLIDVVGSARQVEDAPLLLRPLRVAPRVLEVMRGAWRVDREIDAFAEVMPPTDGADLLLPERLRAEVAGLLLGGAGPVIALCGREGSGRTALFASLAPRGVLRVRLAELPLEPRDLERAVLAALREASLFGLLPVLDAIDRLASDDGLRARSLDRALAGFPGALAATAPPGDRPPIALPRGLVLVDVPLPPEPVRASLWRRALGGASAEVCAHAAARYPITGGVIARSAATAVARARSRGAMITAADVHAGVRSSLDSKLGALGVRIEVTQRWDDLVLPDETGDEIRELIARVKHRKRVHDEWGFADKVGRGLGLSALFFGPPGTGKTMVAGLIGDALGLDVYQIDLSRIVSKWIGETEKNLGQVFDAAEAGHAILLFDEADSLFAKRTEVKSSVDRYANLEVNYLLQRMESFQGISILTTNLDASIDEAFRRRLSARVQFPLPEPDERLRLWRALVPARAALDADVDFEDLAARYAMSGGYIRNAVLRAAFLAADAGTPITMRLLVRAATLEYAAMGKVMHTGLAR